eukprot:56468-Eustigmatos_ZCMA.PRE.1
MQTYTCEVTVLRKAMSDYWPAKGEAAHEANDGDDDKDKDGDAMEIDEVEKHPDGVCAEDAAQDEMGVSEGPVEEGEEGDTEQVEEDDVIIDSDELNEDE